MEISVFKSCRDEFGSIQGRGAIITERKEGGGNSGKGFYCEAAGM